MTTKIIKTKRCPKYFFLDLLSSLSVAWDLIVSLGLVGFYCIRYINVNKQIDSNYKNASIESDQDRIKVINETDDEIESISEGNSKKYFLF